VTVRARTASSIVPPLAAAHLAQMRLPFMLPLAFLVACRSEPRADDPRRGDTIPATQVSRLTSDGCRQTGGQRPDTSIRILDSTAMAAWSAAFARGGLEFACEIRPAVDLRLIPFADSAHPAIDSVLVFGPSDSARSAQVLHRVPGESEAPMPYHTDVLRTIDLDADGWRDLLVGKFWGATGNRGYDVWRYDPASHRFVADSVLSELWNPGPVPGRPCVTTWSNSSARDDGMGVYCLHAGRWRLDSAVTQTWNRDSGTVTREISSRRGDSLVLLKRVTRSDSM